MRPIRNFITRPAIFVVVTLLVAELISRLFFANTMAGRFEYGYHPTAGFLQKGKTIELARAGGRRFRPQKFDLHRPDGVFRIFTVGDSVPRGSSLESAYPAQLVSQLAKRGIRAESLNLGVPGFGARRNQIIFKKVLDYEPSLVILHLNDTNEFEDERESRRAEEAKSWHPKNWLMKIGILARLHEVKTEKLFWKWLPPEIRLGAAMNDADAEVIASENDETRKLWQARLETVTKENIEAARQKNIPVLIVVQVHRKKGTSLFVESPKEAFAQTLKAADVQVISMRETFDGTDLNEFFSDSAHLKPAGHERVAEKIVGQIKQ